MTRLRKIMLEELQRRNYSAVTTRNYLRVVAEFAKFCGKSPDKLGLNELRTYQTSQDKCQWQVYIRKRLVSIRFVLLKIP